MSFDGKAVNLEGILMNIWWDFKQSIDKYKKNLNADSMSALFCRIFCFYAEPTKKKKKSNFIFRKLCTKKIHLIWNFFCSFSKFSCEKTHIFSFITPHQSSSAEMRAIFIKFKVYHAFLIFCSTHHTFLLWLIRTETFFMLQKNDKITQLILI